MKTALTFLGICAFAAVASGAIPADLSPGDLKEVLDTISCSFIPLALNTSVTGQLGECNSTSKFLSTGYSIQLAKGQAVHISLSAPGATGPIGLAFAAGITTPIALAFNSNSVAIDATASSAGTYLIGVFALSSVTGTFSLEATSGALYLSGGRFKVTAAWSTTQGTAGVGTPIPLTDDTGAFWFFTPSNYEMMIKVLDACSFSGHVWVFAGGLTNVNATITVEDTKTGSVRTYVNPQNTAFQPVQDTEAFAACP